MRFRGSDKEMFGFETVSCETIIPCKPKGIGTPRPNPDCHAVQGVYSMFFYLYKSTLGSKFFPNRFISDDPLKVGGGGVFRRAVRRISVVMTIACLATSSIACNPSTGSSDPDNQPGPDPIDDDPCKQVADEWRQIWKTRIETVSLQGPTPETNITDIWGTARDNIFAVGFEGMILHFDGETWTRMESTTDEDIQGIWGYALYDEQGETTRIDVFAAGDKGTILRYDGTAWQAQPVISDPDPQDPDPQPVIDSLHAIWGVAASGPNPDQHPTVIAVGANGLIVKWEASVAEFREMRRAESFEYPCDTGTCTRTRYIRWSPERLGGVFASQSGSFIVVGNNGTIMELNADSWQRILIPGFTTHLNGVWGRGSQEVFAVGTAGTIMRRNSSGVWENLKAIAAGNGGHFAVPSVYLRSSWAFYQTKCGPIPEGQTDPTDTSWGFFAGWDRKLYLLHDKLVCPFGQFDIQRIEGIWGTTPRSEAERTSPDGTEVVCDPVEVFFTGVNGTIIRLMNEQGR